MVKTSKNNKIKYNSSRKLTSHSWTLIIPLLSPLTTNVFCAIFRDDFYVCEKMCADRQICVYMYLYYCLPFLHKR